MALLDEVSFDIYLGDGEIGAGVSFPPERFRLRDARLAALNKLWKGDFSDYQIQYEVSVNYFHSYSTKLANLLLMSNPVAGDVEISQPAYDALVDMTRYGGAILGWDGETLRAYDPLSWYPMLDGDVFVRPFTSVEAPDANFDAVNVLVAVSRRRRGVQHVRLAVRADWEAPGIRVGRADRRRARPPDADYRHMGDGEIRRTVRPDHRNSAAFLAEIGASLDLYSGPIPVFQASTPDAATRYGVPASDTEDERRGKILAGQIGELEGESLHLPDELVGVSFLQPNVSGISVSLAQVAEMKEAVQMLTGLPTLTGASMPSGEALKRVFLHFYSESAAMQIDLQAAISLLLGVEVEWEHIFDQMEMAAFEKMKEQMMKGRPNR